MKSTCKNLGTFEDNKILPAKITYACLAPSHSIIIILVSSGVRLGVEKILLIRQLQIELWIELLSPALGLSPHLVNLCQK